MVRSKELPEAIRKKIVAAYQSSKGFKKISEEFEISRSTVWKIVYKWRTFRTTEMLWGDLKRAVHARKPSNISQLKEFCVEEWGKLSSDRCQRLVNGYKKRLTEVISAKGGNTSY